MYRITFQVRVISIDHGPALRQISVEEVAEPHLLLVPLAFTCPRPVSVTIEATDRYDAVNR